MSFQLLGDNTGFSEMQESVTLTQQTEFGCSKLKAESPRTRPQTLAKIKFEFVIPNKVIRREDPDIDLCLE